MLDQHDKNPHNYDKGFAQNGVKGTQSDKPLIFTKKIKDNYKVIPHNLNLSELGQTKHFPAATREWLNSIYAYNSNTVKNLPALDKTFSKLITSYFNLFLDNYDPATAKRPRPKQKVLSLKAKKLAHKRLAIRFKRIDLAKIYVSKAELKHTSSKVIITLFVYNKEKITLINELNSILTGIVPSLDMWSSLEDPRKDLMLEVCDRPLSSLQRFQKIFKLSFIISSLLDKVVKKNTYNIITDSQDYLCKPGLINKITRKNLTNELTRTKAFYGCSDIVKPDFFKGSIFSAATMINLNQEILEMAENKFKLAMNKAKFEDSFLSKLTPIVSKLYNKEVEFNIVNLKVPYLNTGIFVEGVATLLKNQEKNAVKILDSAAYLTKVSPIKKMKEKFAKDNKELIWINSYKNLSLNSYNSADTNEDYLSQLLTGILSLKAGGASEKEKENILSPIQNLVFENLKHKTLAGLRLETNGRLTKRSSASRSILKVKWAGSLKNIDATYRGLSTVNLRGYAKPNMQYSVIDSKTRNGSFGLKGWIAAK